MAAHYLAHSLGVIGLLHTHVTRPLQVVQAHGPRESGLDQLLIPIHCQHSNFERITVSAIHNVAPQCH